MAEVVAAEKWVSGFVDATIDQTKTTTTTAELEITTEPTPQSPSPSPSPSPPPPPTSAQIPPIEARRIMERSDSNDENEESNNAINIISTAGPMAQMGIEDTWTWSQRHRSWEVVLSGPTNRIASFHPNWSKGTAGVRGNRILNNGRYYWEIQISHRIFGTSMMFGIGTNQARLHANLFRNLLGEDRHGWGLSHKGLLWHKGTVLMYTKRFKENQSTVIGMLFDGVDGTLTYYKDGECLGVAFHDLDKIQEALYPIVCSTAAKTEMILSCTRQEFIGLQDRCRAVICKRIKCVDDLNLLPLPDRIVQYLAEFMRDAVPMKNVPNYDISFA